MLAYIPYMDPMGTAFHSFPPDTYIHLVSGTFRRSKEFTPRFAAPQAKDSQGHMAWGPGTLRSHLGCQEFLAAWWKNEEMVESNYVDLHMYNIYLSIYIYIYTV